MSPLPSTSVSCSTYGRRGGAGQASNAASAAPTAWLPAGLPAFCCLALLPVLLLTHGGRAGADVWRGRRPLLSALVQKAPPPHTQTRSPPSHTDTHHPHPHDHGHTVRALSSSVSLICAWLWRRPRRSSSRLRAPSPLVSNDLGWEEGQRAGGWVGRGAPCRGQDQVGEKGGSWRSPPPPHPTPTHHHHPTPPQHTHLNSSRRPLTSSSDRHCAAATTAAFFRRVMPAKRRMRCGRGGVVNACGGWLGGRVEG